MATPTIPNGEEYFFPIIYEGNGAGQRVGKFVPFTDSGTIDNSCIFNDGDSAYLSRTPSSAGNRRTFTLSCWVKRGNLPATYTSILGTAVGYNSSYSSTLAFNSSQQLAFIEGATNFRITNRTFEDTSKFYHILVSVDTTQATASDRIKIYIDGEQVTSFGTSSDPSLNYELQFNNTVAQGVGCDITTSSGARHFFDGYIAEVNVVDGQALLPASFGETDTSTGRWIPKTLSGITYGTNGFRLEFGDSSALGDDTSGNTNDFTANNLASTDQTTDSPTQNHATLMVNGANISSTFSEGNLKVTLPTTSAMTGGLSTLRMVSGKYYMEATVDSISSAGLVLGIMGSDQYTATNEFTGTRFDAYGYYSIDGNLFNNYDSNSTSFAFGNSYTTSDVIGIAVDLDNDKLYFSKNGTFQNSANPSAGTGGQSIISAKSTTAGFYRFCLTDGGTGSTDIVTANFGQKSFTYTPPTGFVALQQDNLPTTDKGVSGLVWTKNRDATDNHQLYDSSRGKQLILASNATSAEATVTDGLQKFLAGGQQIEDNVAINTSGESFVTWNWVANSGTTASNTDGSITSTVQANTTAGFSIIQYVGTSSNATVGHGLSSTPDWVMLKNLDQSTAGSGDWMVWHKDIANTEYLSINDTDAKATLATAWNSTSPTSSVISIGTATRTNNSGDNHIIYAWHGVEGFSKFGKYVGNLSSDGPFIYTGFTPTWLLIKNSADGSQWRLFDGKRNTFNPVNKSFRANDTTVEYTDNTYYLVDFLSNGFKIRGAGSTDMNSTAGNYIYMCFAEHPFVGDGTSPVTAR